MMNYISIRIIDGKPRKVVVDETGKIVNKNPTKDELNGLKRFPEENYVNNKDNRKKLKYTDKELLNYIIQFYKKYGRSPTMGDFAHKCPHYKTYIKHFGRWSNALKLAGLDVESIVKKGIIEISDQKARFAEIIIRDHFKKSPIDLAGENKNSPCDGICPNRMTYDVKSSKLYKGKDYIFRTNNKFKDDIEIYYFLAFNEDYTELRYVWRIPGEIVESSSFYVWLSDLSRRKFTVENLKEFDITDKIREVLGKYGFFNKSKKKEIKGAYNRELYDGYKELYDGYITTE